ncbi:MAG: hypothetical protein LBT13_02890 [Treponema sp.]|jgi:hypothetical protein|nr:hypothetical protein [Treponema sp.]
MSVQNQEPVTRSNADAAAIAEKRRLARYSCLAGVRINSFEGEALLRDINDTGFCMASKTYVAINPNEKYIMWIAPESETEIEPFELELEVRWVRSTASLFEAGFSVVKPPENNSLQKYVNHLKGRTLVEEEVTKINLFLEKHTEINVAPVSRRSGTPG